MLFGQDYLSSKASDALLSGDLGTMSQHIGCVLSLQTPGSDASIETTTNMFNLISNVNTVVPPTNDQVVATVTMLSLVCNEPASISGDLHLPVLDLMTNSANTLVLEAETGQMLLSTIANVVTSLHIQQSVSNSSLKSASNETLFPVGPAQIATAYATLRALDSLSLGLGGALVPGQSPAILNVSGLELQAQVFSDVTALHMKSASGGAFSVGSSGSLTSAGTVCASLSVSPASLYGGPADSGLFSLSLFDCATRSPVEYVPLLGFHGYSARYV
jgi:hypothetical protein